MTPVAPLTSTRVRETDVDRGVVLVLEGVVKNYPGEPPIRALDGVTLQVRSGELVGIVGPSGSGKSTLLNIIGALDRPTTGRVRIDGDDVTAVSDAQLSALRARSIGFVFQQFHLRSETSALENVADGLLYRGVPQGKRRQRAADALERVGLAHRMTHRPTKLSGGERQRVAIARAIVGEPAIVLADEPTGNLDSKAGDEVFELFRTLHDTGRTIVIITHNLALAEQLPRRIHLRDGQIELDHENPGAR